MMGVNRARRVPGAHQVLFGIAQCGLDRHGPRKSAAIGRLSCQRVGACPQIGSDCRVIRIRLPEQRTLRDDLIVGKQVAVVAGLYLREHVMRKLQPAGGARGFG